MGLSQLVIHEVKAAIPEPVRVPSEVLILIGDINVEPDHIEWEIIEVEAEIHIGHVFGGEVGPATLMIA
jgi:hypothetical protein